MVKRILRSELPEWEAVMSVRKHGESTVKRTYKARGLNLLDAQLDAARLAREDGYPINSPISIDKVKFGRFEAPVVLTEVPLHKVIQTKLRTPKKSLTDALATVELPAMLERGSVKIQRRAVRLAIKRLLRTLNKRDRQNLVDLLKIDDPVEIVVRVIELTEAASRQSI